MNLVLLRLWSALVFISLLSTAPPARAAEAPATFILDTSFRFDAEAVTVGGRFSPPFIGGPRVALLNNGQMILSQSLVRLNTDGTVDDSFQAEVPFGAAVALAVDKDRNVYTAIRGEQSNTIFKLNSRGEKLWAKEVLPNYSYVSGLLVRRDGTLLVGGSFTNVAGVNRTSVALLSPDGAVRDELNMQMDGPVTCAEETADGSIYLGGDFERVNGVLRPRVVKMLASGLIDHGFDPGSLVTEDVTAIAVDQIGRVVVSGHFNPGNGAPATRLMRLLPNGTLDTTFNTGTGLDGAAASVKIDDAHRIVLAGAFTRVNGTLRPRIARLLQNGSLDQSYNPGQGLNQTATDLVIDGAGKYMVAGYFGKVGHRSAPGIARLLNHSDLQTADFTDEVFRTNEQYGGTGIHLQRFGDSAGELVAHVTLVPGDDPAVSEFAPFETTVTFAPGETFKVASVPLADDGIVEDSETVRVRCVVPAAGMETWSKIEVADNEVPVILQRRFGSLDALVSEPVAAVADGKVAVGGFLGWGVPTTQGDVRGVMVFSENGEMDQNFGIVALDGDQERRVRAVDWTSDGKLLVGGQFSHVRGSARRNLVRFNADGSVDTNFNPNVPVVMSMAVLPDGKILTAPGHNAPLIRLLPSGQLDTSFQAGVAAFIRQVKVQPDGKILVHGDRLPLIRLLPDGGEDPTFANPIFEGPFGRDVDLTDIQVANDGKIYVTGAFSEVQGVHRAGLVRLLPNGAVDPGFAPGGYFPAWNAPWLLREDGKLVIGSDLGLILVKEDGSRDGEFLSRGEVLARSIQPLLELRNGSVLANVGWNGGASYGLHILQLKNASKIEINSADLIVREGTTKTGIEVKRIGDVSQALTATISIPDAPGEDLVIPSEVKFAVMQTTAQIELVAKTDGLIEEDEMHHIRVSGENLIDSDFEVVVLDANGRPGSIAFDPFLQSFENAYALAPMGEDSVVVAQGRWPFLMKLDRSEGTKEVFNALHDFNMAPQSLARAGDNLLVGGMQIMAGPHEGRLVRLNSDGSVDSTFKEPRLHLLPSFIMPQPDGKILVAGEFLGGTNVGYNYALINTDGTLVRVFTKLDRAYQMPAVVNGQLHYHTRTSDHSGQRDRLHVVAVATGNTVGTSMDVDGYVFGIVAERDSALVYGAISGIGWERVSGLARLKNGAVDPTFRPEILPKEVYEAHVDAEGRIVILGQFRQINGVEVAGFARLLPNGSLDRGFRPTASMPPNEQMYYRSLVQLGNGDYAALGNFPGRSIFGVVWINADLPFAGRFGRRSDSSPLGLVFNSEPGKRYRVESSEDFSAWSPVLETNAVGFQIWIDATLQTGVMFYRAGEMD